MNRRVNSLLLLILLAGLAVAGPAFARARMDLERYSKLREAERYQIDVADRLFDGNKWAAALKEYEKYLKLHGIKSVGTPYAQLRIAQCLENSRNLNQAIREYQALVKIFPESTDAPAASLAIARCYYNIGETNKAIEAYSETVTKFPKDNLAAEALYELSKLQPDKAVAYRMQIVDDYETSRWRDDAANKLVDHFLFSEDNIDAARNVYQKLTSPVKTEMHIAGRLYDTARWYYRYRRDEREMALKRMDKAIEIYESIPEQFPDKTDQVESAERMIALCYKETGRNDEGAKAFEAYLKTHPEDDSERRNYGRLLEAMGTWGEARLQYAQFKDKAAGAREQAESYHRQHKVEEAEEAYLRVVQQFPDHAKWALYRAGEMHLHVSKDYQKAITFYRRSEYSPPHYLFRVGYAFERWGKWTEAIDTYRQIRGFFRRYAPQAMKEEAEALEHRKEKGDLNSAIKLMKSICDTYPKSGEASWAHQQLEHKYNIPYTGGGMHKGE